jgi:hypothetical protein
MKKNIIILSILIAGAVGFMFVLVRKSDTEMLVLDAPRRYGSIDAKPMDTIRFPGTLTVIKADGNFLYAYVHSERALYRWNLATRVMDTIVHTGGLFAGTLSGADIDLATGTFYFLNANSNRAYSCRSGDLQKDSVSFGALHMANGDKCFNSDAFFLRCTDDATSLTSLKKGDSTLYDLTHFADGGISADGFFVKDASSKKHYYVPFYNAEVIQFDEGSNKVSKIVTIDKTKPSNSVVPTSNGYTISSKSRAINLAADADSADLYVLSLSSAPGKHELPGTMIDMYSTSTGQYERSLQVPYFEGHPMALLARSGYGLFAAFDNSVLSYKIR